MRFAGKNAAGGSNFRCSEGFECVEEGGGGKAGRSAQVGQSTRTRGSFPAKSVVQQRIQQ